MSIVEILLYVILAMLILFLLLKIISAVGDVIIEILNFFCWIIEKIQKMCIWLKKRISKKKEVGVIDLIL